MRNHTEPHADGFTCYLICIINNRHGQFDSASIENKMKMKNDLAQTANLAMSEWSRQMDKLVVGIDGYPGVGKSTLASELLKINHNILLVERDDFSIERSVFEAMLAKAEDRTQSFEFDMTDLPRLRQFILAYKTNDNQQTNVGYNRVTGKLDVQKTYDFSKSILLVEGVFLFHAELTDDLFDRRIFLQGNLEQVAKRRVAREKARWGEEYFPEDHPDSYFRLAIQAFDRYVATQHPKQRADLVLSTTD